MGCCFDTKNSPFILSSLEAVRMPQRTYYPAFSSIGEPKKKNMLLFVQDAQTLYYTKSGKTVPTHDGDVVYVPQGSEYRVQCTTNGERGETLQINFLLFDEAFTPFVFSEEICVFTPKSGRLRTLFETEMSLFVDISATSAKKKAVLYEILDVLIEENAEQAMPSLLLPALSYLHTHYEENPSIEMLCAMCHISEEYFRRIFKNEMHTSPTEYKNALRLARAEHYLLYSDWSVGEIAHALSYATVSHFIKAFRERYSLSPLQYRMKSRKNIEK